jgi:hypothetical protein
LLTQVGMSPQILAAETLEERLWTASDGTVCVLSTCATPPMYVVSLVRNTQVLRERRLYGLASAKMLAQGWREAQYLDASRFQSQ